MPHINLDEVDDLPPVYKFKRGKRKVIPRHVIRKLARDAFLGGKPGFNCPECHISYAMAFGAIAKKGNFGERTHYCLDCIDSNVDIHKC